MALRTPFVSLFLVSSCPYMVFEFEFFFFNYFLFNVIFDTYLLGFSPFLYANYVVIMG